MLLSVSTFAVFQNSHSSRKRAPSWKQFALAMSTMSATTRNGLGSATAGRHKVRSYEYAGPWDAKGVERRHGKRMSRRGEKRHVEEAWEERRRREVAIYASEPCLVSSSSERAARWMRLLGWVVERWEGLRGGKEQRARERASVDRPPAMWQIKANLHGSDSTFFPGQLIFR